MIKALNYYELRHLVKWLNAITGTKSTLGDLQKYIIKNKITNNTRLLNKLNADFVKLPD